MENKTQWQKRVDLTQYLYSCLIKNLKDDELKQDFYNADSYQFDANQLKTLEYFAANQNKIIET